jgi:SAM-dependent methyltransferase
MLHSKESTEFSDDQYSQAYADGMDSYFWTIARNRIIERHVRGSLDRSAGAAPVVLDIGCGTGIVVDHLRKAGINCLGVELGRPTVLATVRDFVKTGSSALETDADRAVCRVILLLDVLEHIEHPDAFLRSLLEKYRLAEHIIVTVPARQELWSNYDEHYGHFLRYDKPAMRELAEKCGLQIKELKYLFAGLYPVILMQRLIGGRSLEPRPPKGVLERTFHTLAALGFRLEERLPGVGSIPGSSLLAVLNVRRNETQ